MEKEVTIMTKGSALFTPPSFSTGLSIIASDASATAEALTAYLVAGVAGKLTSSPQTVSAREVASLPFNVLGLPQTLP